jgi:N utilization substance protein B
MTGSTRRKGRELALQVLYQLEMSGGDLEQALRAFADSFERSPKAREFGTALARGVLARREDIDGLIAGASEHWRLERLSRIDANVIRIAVFEMTSDPPLPMEIAINEAIEVVKRYGTAESAAFVNGVLDELAKRLGLERGHRARLRDRRSDVG